MDVIFSCPNCKQELAAESAVSGSQIECPSCNHPIIVPEADPANVKVANPIASSAAAREDRHFSVPVHEGPAESLIQKPHKPLVAAAKEGEGKIRIHCIKRTECVEVGKDRFDDVVSEFLQAVGEPNIINIMPLVYTHLDIGSQKLMTDYGVMIVYRG